MEGFLTRIGLGCGRLRGGVEEANSRQIIEAALDCGIRYFDTAPSYGGGASERILGVGLRGLRKDVELCTKVGLSGSPPGAAATLRALLLTTVRSILPASVLDRLKTSRRAPPHRLSSAAREYGDFDIALAGASVERSLEELNTDHLDCLMLHEPRPSDPAPEVADWMHELVRGGKALRLGVGTYSQLQDLPPFGDVAQCAIGASVFADGGSRQLVCHGVLRQFDRPALEHCLMAAGLMDGMPALGRFLSEPLGGSALLLNAVLAGSNIRRVLVSTGSPARLRAFMAAAQRQFEEIQSGGSAQRQAGLRAAAQQYFAQKRQAAG